MKNWALILGASSGIGAACAKKLAEAHKINLKFFNIIYEVLDFVNDALSGLLKPDI